MELHGAGGRRTGRVVPVPGRTWVPPTLSAPVSAARASPLARFHPFTGHARLRFSTGPRFRPGEGTILPVSVALGTDGRFLVRAQEADGRQPPALVLAADTPAAAVAAVVRLLEGV
nr:DUF6193 family natural product biosynthesis protein [Streptomyces sp. TLI_235]